MRYSPMTRFLRRSSTLTAGVVASAFVLPVAGAQEVRLDGSWNGGGQIVFPSGEKERAQCRASFRHQGGKSYGMSATCATPSIKVQQSAKIVHVSGNRYHGEFVNQEYGITGSVRIVVTGNRLSASLSGGGGTAEFALSR